PRPPSRPPGPADRSAAGRSALTWRTVPMSDTPEPVPAWKAFAAKNWQRYVEWVLVLLSLWTLHRITGSEFNPPAPPSPVFEQKASCPCEDGCQCCPACKGCGVKCC